MPLKGRLSRLTSFADSLQRPESLGRPSAGIEDCRLPGSLRETSAGPLRVIQHRYPFNEPYGCVEIGAALQCSGEVLAALGVDTTLGEASLKSALFLDTETTGLAGGAGTLAFLTGLSWFEDDGLVVEQYFVENFGRETPLLLELRDRLAQASCVVTFNGKSFDWPLLRNRFVMNRLPAPEPPVHFDLLHSARRLLKRRLKSMRLVALEESVLQTYRQDDVPGEEIPQIYFDFLATGVFGRLQGVLEHNRLDLLAMPALVAWLNRLYTDIDAADSPLDWIGVASVAERIGDHERAQRYAQAAVESGSDVAAETEGRIILARYCHRRREYPDEVAHLQKAIDLAVASFQPYLNLRLAITMEHKLRRYTAALQYAQNTIGEEGYLESEKRQARLRRRLTESTCVA